MLHATKSSLRGSPGIFVLALIVLALAGAACVKRPTKGVSLQNVDTDVAFGVKSPQPVAPANVEVPEGPIDESESFNQFAFRSRFSGPTSSRPRCPTAPVTAAAPQEAPLNAEGVPVAGVYRWKFKGVREPTSPPGLKLSFGPGFERREIRKVQRISSTDYRFEMLQPDLSTSDVVGTTFKVRTAAASTRPPGVPDQRTGEPDRGMSIERIERYDAKTGNAKGEIFTPNPSVLEFPLPAFAGERFQSAGVDASSRGSLTVDGFVPKRELVDACGQLIDGWKIEMRRTISGPQGTHTYHMIVATQKGALPISEYFELQDANGKVTITYSIAQLEPDPPGSAGS